MSSVQRTGTGAYNVIFNQDVTQCAYIPVIGSIGTDMPAGGNGFARGAQLAGNPNGVLVWTWPKDPASPTADLPFHIAVFC